MIDKKIIAFMEAQTCASICCVDELAMPWCFSCFFEWNSEDALLYFKSSTEARHSIMLKANPAIAGTVLPDTLNKLMVKGVQFEGAVVDPADKHAQAAGGFYHKKNPLALAIPGSVWAVQTRQLLPRRHQPPTNPARGQSARPAIAP